MRKYTALEIRPLQTLSTGQCCSLKIQSKTQRVWLRRVGNGVSVETLSGGRWTITSGSCTSTEARGE